MENNLKRSVCVSINVCIYVFLNRFAVHLKVTQYCKSTAVQFFKKPQHSKLFWAK